MLRPPGRDRQCAHGMSAGSAIHTIDRQASLLRQETFSGIASRHIELSVCSYAYVNSSNSPSKAASCGSEIIAALRETVFTPSTIVELFQDPAGYMRKVYRDES